MLHDAVRFDLHMHSTRSDGAVGADELVERAAAGGLDVVAITDHDLATDLAFGVHRIGARSVRVLAGAEVSGVHAGKEYHLLVYFPREVPTAFHAFCAERCRERAVRYQASVDAIGLPDVERPDDAAHRGDRSLTRHHLARALVAAGHARDVREAFRRYADDAHGNVPRVSLPLVDAIRIARELGGVTSWAHPPLAAIEAHVAELAEAGLQGLEGIRPLMSTTERRKVRKLADAHGLFLTGGSDWHGWTEPDLGLFAVERRDLAGFLAALDAVA